MTKKQTGLFNSYYHAYMNGAKTELYQVYGNYSRAKQAALDYCKVLQNRFGGYNATIVGHSSHFFSYAFLYYDADIKKECLCYCTHANDYKFPIE
ncbi:hypothetical protein J6O48_08385 [bacterium]|nr:hypothetical protein [bacterium]